MNLTDNQRKKGVITTSAGNWAQAAVYASHIFNVKSVIVMKEGTSYFLLAWVFEAWETGLFFPFYPFTLQIILV